MPIFLACVIPALQATSGVGFDPGATWPQVAPLDFGRAPVVPEQEMRGWEANEVGPLGRAWRAITSNVSDMPGSVRLVAPLEMLEICAYIYTYITYICVCVCVCVYTYVHTSYSKLDIDCGEAHSWHMPQAHQV